MNLKEVKKIIFVSGDSNCIIDYVDNFYGDTIGITFRAYAIYNKNYKELSITRYGNDNDLELIYNKNFEELKVTHYYNDEVLEMIENGERDKVAEIESDTYDCFVNFDKFELDNGLEGFFENDDEVIIDGVKIACEIVGDEFDYDDFTSKFEEE